MATNFPSLIRAEADRMLAVGAGPLEAIAPSCPAWNVATLICHVGWVTRWYRYLLGLAEGEEQTEEGLVAAGVPAEGGSALQRPDGDLVAWFQQGVEELLQAYEETPPTKMVNTVYAVRTSPLLLIRRMAHELAIHRWDAEQAQRTPAGFDGALAADGVDELLEYWLPRAKDTRWPGYSFRWAELSATGQTIHLHSTDSADGWLITLNPDSTELRRGHDEDADVTARGKLDEFYLLVWKRYDVDRLGTVGHRELLKRWHAAARHP